jgi:YggT family protein
MLDALHWLFNTLVILYLFVLVGLVIMSWLAAYKVIDAHNPPIERVDRALIALTNPALNPVRRLIPPIGGLDFSPVVLILALEFLRRLVNAFLLAGGGAPPPGAG